MEESPKSTSDEPSKRESFAETTGRDDIFKDDEEDWNSANKTFSSDEDDDNDDDDGPDPPEDISGHLGVYPENSTHVDSDDEQKGESKKREHVSTSSTEDEHI